MNLFFLGSDKPLFRLKKDGFRRRNSFFLKGFIESSCYQNVFVINRVSFYSLFKYPVIKALINNIIYNSQNKDIFTFFLPSYFSRFDFKVNFFLVKLQTRVENNEKDIIYCYWPKALELANDLKLKGRIIFDADHNIIGDVNLSKSQKENRIKFLIKNLNRAYLIIAGSRSMLQWCCANNFTRTSYIRNGIDLNRYNQFETKDTFNIVLNKRKPIIGYSGIFSNWINIELLKALIIRNPQWDFILIGDFNDKIEFSDLNNVNLLGYVDPDLMPKVLKRIDIGLCLYKRENWLDGDSMKIFDYLASGIPVVSTPFHKDLKDDFENLICIANDISEFESEINNILNYSFQKKESYRNLVNKFLLRNSWETRVHEINNLL